MNAPPPETLIKNNKLLTENGCTENSSLSLQILSAKTAGSRRNSLQLLPLFERTCYDLHTLLFNLSQDYYGILFLNN